MGPLHRLFSFDGATTRLILQRETVARHWPSSGDRRACPPAVSDVKRIPYV